MTAELVLLLTALWITFGLVDAWVLHQLGSPGWRWTLVCVLTGPLSVSVLYDRRYLAEHDRAGDSSTSCATEGPDGEIDEGEPVTGIPDDWPSDDPEGPFVLQGYRGLADH